VRRVVKAGTFVAVGMILGMLFAPQAVQAAVNYFDTTRVVTAYGYVACPSGWKVTGGGVYSLPSDSSGSTLGSPSSTEYKLTGSYPYGQGWKATARKTNGYYSSYSGWRFYTYNYSPRVYAICTA
jgi:hypothetical protein